MLLGGGATRLGTTARVGVSTAVVVLVTLRGARGLTLVVAVEARAVGSRRVGRRLTMDLHVFPQRARVGVALVTAADLAVVRLVARVHVTVLLPVRAVSEATVASLKFTFKWLLSCMCSFVDLEVFTSGEHLTTAGEGTGERLLPGVYADMVN